MGLIKWIYFITFASGFFNFTLWGNLEYKQKPAQCKCNHTVYDYRIM